MSAVARMTALDLRSLTPYRNQFLLLVGIGAVWAFASGQPGGTLPMFTVYAALVGSYPFAVADKYDLDTLYGVLPVTRRAVLLGRYAGALLTFLAVAVLGLVLTVTLAWVRSVDVDGRELAVVLAVSWAIFAALVAVQYPCFVRLGYTRARLISVLPFAVLFGAGTLLATRVHPTGTPSPWWLLVIAVAGAAALVVSYLVSVRIDPRRE